ncbi:MAG: helix-turn-helix domain-containing protein [Desulfobacterales bacterium]|nr:helix-turn-helix domain-containing protein [Desulfobacterales bacterium]
MAKSNGNKSRAEKVLGISRRTLYRKIREYKITSYIFQDNRVCHVTGCAIQACAMSHIPP